MFRDRFEKTMERLHDALKEPRTRGPWVKLPEHADYFMYSYTCCGRIQLATDEKCHVCGREAPGVFDGEKRVATNAYLISENYTILEHRREWSVHTENRDIDVACRLKDAVLRQSKPEFECLCLTLDCCPLKRERKMHIARLQAVLDTLKTEPLTDERKDQNAG
jgi:hypothetical protein